MLACSTPATARLPTNGTWRGSRAGPSARSKGSPDREDGCGTLWPSGEPRFLLAQLTINPSIDSLLSIDSLPNLTRRVAAQYPSAVSAGPPNQVVNGGMQTFPAALGVHPGVHPGVGLKDSHGPTTAPTPRTAAPTSESTYSWAYPWGVPQAAAKKPPRAKKANPCASNTAHATIHATLTPHQHTLPP